MHSPGAGVIADRPLYAGDIAVAGTPLLVVMDISRVVARVNVPTADAGLVRVGQPATILLPETGKEVEGKVDGGQSGHRSQQRHGSGVGAGG